METPVKWLLGIGLVASILIAVYYFGLFDGRSSGDIVANGRVYKKAPTFELMDKSGAGIQLESFKGKPLFVHFWASWCPPCVEELPNLFEFAEKNVGKNVSFLIISLDEKWQSAIDFLPKQLPKNVFSVLDEGGNVAKEYGSFEYPETYLISKEQHIVTKWVGPQKWSSEFFDKVIQKFQ